MKKSLAARLVGALLFCSGPAFSQQSAAGPLTWQDCVVLALKNNPGLISSRQAEAAGLAGYRSSFNGVMPSLSLTNSYNTSNSATQATNKYSAAASASMNLFNASSLASIQSSKASLRQAEANLRVASANLRFSLRQAFDQAIFAQESIAVTRMILEIRRHDAEMVTLRYDSGRESKGNMMRAKAQVVQAEADLGSSQRNLRAAQKALAQQLGFDDFQVVGATGTLEAAVAPTDPGDEAAYLSRRPDVAVQEAVVKSAMSSVSTARAPLWPSLTGSYSRQRLSTYEFPGALYAWTGGLTLSLPIFGAGPTATYFNVAAAKDNLAKAQADLRAVKNAAVVDLENGWSTYSGAMDQLRVQRALLEAARQRNDEADVQYASGLTDYNTWEIIASDRINTEKQALNAALNASVSQASWEKSIGKELGE